MRARTRTRESPFKICLNPNRSLDSEPIWVYLLRVRRTIFCGEGSVLVEIRKNLAQNAAKRCRLMPLFQNFYHLFGVVQHEGFAF